MQGRNRVAPKAVLEIIESATPAPFTKTPPWIQAMRVPLLLANRQSIAGAAMWMNANFTEAAGARNRRIDKSLPGSSGALAGRIKLAG